MPRVSFDWTVNPAVVLSVIVILAAVVGAWAANNTRLDSIERQMTKMSDLLITQAVVAERVNGLAERLGRLERR